MHGGGGGGEGSYEVLSILIPGILARFLSRRIRKTFTPINSKDIKLFWGVVIFFWSLNQVGPTSDLVTEYSLSSDFSNGPFDGRATIETQLC